jgi:TRAP-type C4-dicarboxylate transport system permease small subunit
VLDRPVLRHVRKACELVSAGLFALLFGSFLIQIFTRYVLNNPVIWAQELCSLAYLWVTCFAAATIVKEREHISFDLLYQGARPPVRRVLAVIGTAVLVILFAIGLPGTIDYVAFMGRMKTLDLRIPFDRVFSIFVFFLAMGVLLGAVRLWRLMRPGYEREL